MVLCGSHLYALGEDAVYRVSRDLESIAVEGFQSTGAFACADGTVLLAAEESLIALDGQMARIGQVELGVGKDAHDIIVHGGKAFLIDDKYMPVYLIKLDISNPQEMRIDEKIGFGGVYGHLALQWLDPKRDRWIVLYTPLHREILLSFSMTENADSDTPHLDSGFEKHQFNQFKRMGIKPAAPINKQPLYTKKRDGGTGPAGIFVESASALAPAWTVIRPASSRFGYLARARYGGENIRFTKVMDLPELNGRRNSQVMEHGAHVVMRLGNRIAIMEKSDPSGLVFESFRDHLNVGSVKAVLPYGAKGPGF